MLPQHKELFDSIMIGNCEIPNRYAMSPMGPFGFVDQQGILTDLGVEYYVARARGGIGLVQTGICLVDSEIEGVNPTVMFLTKNTNKWYAMQQMSKLTERVHAYGSKIFLQLASGWGRSSKVPGLTRNAIAPSEVTNRYNPNITHRAMTTEEVETMIQAYGAAAAFAKHVGFDGVQVHAVHEGYLMDQFATEAWNHRTDRFGGSFENRYRFATETVEIIKKYCGKDYPVSVRFSPKHYMKAPRDGAIEGEDFVEFGRDWDEGMKAAQLLVAAGYDALDVDVGCYDSHYMNHPTVYQPDGLYLEAAKRVKEVVDVPVIVAGRMDDPDLGAKSIREGLCDMVSLGRPSLADAEIPNKVRDGHPERIRHCISCNIGCGSRVLFQCRLTCTLNAQTGNEIDSKLTPAVHQKNIAVVGAGPAGSEFARVAAMRGHKVTVLEQNDRVGGNLIVASKPSFKSHDEQLANWFANEMSIEGVDVRLNTKATIENIKELNPDVVISALGAKPVIPPIPGVEHAVVAEDILNDISKAGKKVVVIGGGQVGTETAIWLAKEGHEVTIVEALPTFMAAASEQDVEYAERAFALNNGKIMLSTKVESISEKTVKVTNENGTVELEADTVIIATGYKADNGFVKELKDNFDTVYNIGDSVKTRNVYFAIHEAYELAANI